MAIVMATPSSNIDDEKHHPSFIQACPLLLDTNITTTGSSSDINKLKKYNIPSLYSLQDNSHIIRQEVLRVLKIHQYDNGGTGLSLPEMAMWLGVENEEDVITIGDALIQSQDDEQQQDEDIICKVYNNRDKKCQYALVNSLRSHIEERIKWHCSGNTTLQSAANNGTSSSSSMIDIVAQEVQLTSDDVAMLLQKSERNGTTTKTASAVSNPNYTSHLETQVLATLSGITAPISLDKLFDNEQDQNLIVSLAKQLCQEGRLSGTVSSSSSSLTSVVYTPNIFTHLQRNLVDSFFQTNHYITEKKCVGVGIVGSSKMEEFVKESFPDVILLSHSIIDPKFICQPLEMAIQTALLNEGFADLKALIPLDVANIDDVEQLINECLVDVLKAQEDRTMYDAFSKGTVLINSDIALFFSHEMCQKSVANAILDPLVESYSKERAREIVESRSRGAAARGSKKGKSSSQTIESTTFDEDLIPLRLVANCIGEHYPDLLQLQQTYDEDFGGADSSISLSWIPEEASTDKCDGPLIEFCRVAIYSQIERKCTRAVKAEVASLDSARHGVSVSERSVGAAKQMDTQEAFEHEFKDLCHLFQLLAKTIESFSAKSMFSCAEICSLKRELLVGIGSNFAKTVTEYCLFKHNIQERSHALAFDSAQGLGRPPVDMLDFPLVSLQYKHVEGGKTADPLLYLRELLPGSSGLSLVRIWQLIEVKDDNKVNENLDELITHLTETCLTLVGIPFSILDKKTEKKVMTQRRQGLIERIEKSQDPGEILNTCVVLIYQNTRNLVIAGQTMISLVLDLFEEEKKIPKKVTDVLLKLKQESRNVSPELLALAKQFGTAKNSKALSAMCE